MSSLQVLAAGALTTVQDRGRVGLAHLGVPRAGALDQPAGDLANRLVGNQPEAALLEVTLGGLELRCVGGAWVAVTGARAPMRVDDRPRDHERAEWLPDGAVLALGGPTAGVRSYLAVAGGIDVAPVLGSRSTDTLAWVGPARVREGDELDVGTPTGTPLTPDTPRPPAASRLRLLPGPHRDWFAGNAFDTLCASSYDVRPESNRIGLRLAGPAVERVRVDELPSEGMVLGAVQVPPDGQPVVLLADHPVTGGYPVVAVVHPDDLWLCAQVRPGESVPFRSA